MARSADALANGSRMSDYVSLGVVAKAFPAEKVREVLRETGKESVRERALPAHVVVYYVIALALYMQVSCREVRLSKASLNVHVAGTRHAAESALSRSESCTTGQFVPLRRRTRKARGTGTGVW